MILDTNALSAVTDYDREIIVPLSKAKQLAITIISLGEISYGIKSSRYQKQPTSWLSEFLKRTQILYLDLESIRHYAQIHTTLKKSGTPIPANDCWIAALARQHRMSVLTRDRHFECVSDIKVLTW